MRGKERETVKRVSEERVAELLSQADACFGKNPQRSQRYCKIAFGIVKKNKVRLSKGQNLSFCRKCSFYWKPGSSVNVSFDKRNRRVLYTCTECGYKRKLGYGRRRARV